LGSRKKIENVLNEMYLLDNQAAKKYLSAFIFIYQTGSNINNYNNEKLNDKYLIRYYKLLQNWRENHSL